MHVKPVRMVQLNAFIQRKKCIFIVLVFLLINSIVDLVSMCSTFFVSIFYVLMKGNDANNKFSIFIPSFLNKFDSKSRDLEKAIIYVYKLFATHYCVQSLSFCPCNIIHDLFVNVSLSLSITHIPRLFRIFSVLC